MEYEISNEDVQKYNEADDEKNITDMNDKLCNCIRNDICQMIQPILYMRKVPDDSVIKTKEDLQMLHTSPIIGTAEVMLNSVTSRLSEDGFKESLGSSACSSLGFNQIDITVNELTNYIIQNIMISFCSMLDNAGETFKAMVLNTRIKAIVNEELNSDEMPSISTLLYRFLSRTGENSYTNTFDPSNNNIKCEKDMQIAFNNLMEYNSHVANQLNQLIYYKLCKACDKAISEILLGTRVSPNCKYIVDAGMKYFNLSYKDYNQNKYEVYYRLNTTLVDMIDKFMCAVVVHMNDIVVNKMAYITYSYMYEIISRENFKDISRENFQKLREKNKDNYKASRVYEIPVDDEVPVHDCDPFSQDF